MSLIRLNDVSMQFDGRPVLSEAFLKLRRGDRIGLIGKNGTGKTTLLELVLGRREPSGGTVDVTLGTTIGYFSQFSELDGEQSTYETLSAHFTAVHETQARLDEIVKEFADDFGYDLDEEGKPVDEEIEVDDRRGEREEEREEQAQEEPAPAAA